MTIPKTVVVTGASSGIGRASALLLARKGFTVFAGVRREADGDRLVRHGGEGIVPLLVDVTDGAAVAAAAESVARAVGDRGLGGLLNNAGIGLAAPLEYVRMDEVRRLFEVNLFGQLAVTQALLPMIRRAAGRIVNIGSIGTHLPIPFAGVLNGTKHALTAFNDSLRLELKPYGIRVVLVEPASIYTPAVEKTLGSADEAVRALPPDGGDRYGSTLRAFIKRAHAREVRGSPPEVVAEVVLRALTARRPKPRYIVGKDARPLTLLPRLLPIGLLDRLELRVLGLPAGR
jgi:NAD(P)-dependent dehydrogenase (short-subunit alcohol dehydrogenase family)